MTTDFTALVSAISAPLTCERSLLRSPTITNLTETTRNRPGQHRRAVYENRRVVNGGLNRAARAVRSAFRRIRAAPSNRTTTVPPAIHQFTTTQPANPCEQDMILLAALTLGGLINPAAAMIIAILEANRTHDQRRVR